MSNILRLAIINLMPQAECYEEYINKVVPIGTEIEWIRVRRHSYNSSNHEILSQTHKYYSECDIDSCDAVLLTGSAMDRDPDLTAARYWGEVVETLQDARGRVGSVAGVCWGAQVVAKSFYGIDKRHFPAKLSGVFEMTNLQPDHRLMRQLDDRYWLPQSRYAEMEPAPLKEAVDAGEIVPLDYAEGSGHATLVSRNGDLVMMQGHQDYPTGRLAQEYRDARARGEDPPSPLNYDTDNPVNRWRANNRAFFAAWLDLASERRQEACTSRKKSALIETVE
jgi:homoserine O-succinyltransferase/O-acetyltransferase